MPFLFAIFFSFSLSYLFSSNYPLNEKNTKVLLKEMWENTQLDGNSVIVVFPDSKRLTALKSQAYYR